MEESDILKKLGLNDSNKWILDDGASLFFKWCVQNLDPDKNVLAENEYFQPLASISEKSEFIACQLETKYPGLLSIDKNGLTEREKYAWQLQQENNERKDRIMKLEEIVRGEKYIDVGKIEIQQNKLEMKRFTKEIRCKIKALENKRGANIKQLSRATRRLKSENFLFQSPSDQFLNIINKICDNTNVFMRERFNLRSSFKDDMEIFKDPHELCLTSEKNKIVRLSQQKLNLEMNLAGIDFAIHHINEKITCARSEKNFEKKVHIKEWIAAEKNQEQLIETLFQELLQMKGPQFKSIYGICCQKKLAENS